MKTKQMWISAVLLAVMLCGPAYGFYEGAAPFCPAPTVDVTGDWEFSSNNKSDSVEFPNHFTPFPVQMIQSGNTITFLSPFESFTDGQICGNVITWRGNYPDVGGTTYVDVFYLRVSADGKSARGMDHWIWTSGDTYSEYGTDWFTGSKKAE